MSLGQQAPLGARLTPIGGIGTGPFSHLTEPWLSPRPWTATPNPARSSRRIPAAPPATISRTRWLFATSEIDHRRCWGRPNCEAKPSTGSRSATRRKWRSWACDHPSGVGPASSSVWAPGVTALFALTARQESGTCDPHPASRQPSWSPPLYHDAVSNIQFPRFFG